MLTDILGSPALVLLFVGIPGTILGILGYRRAVRADRTATVDAATTAAGETTRRIINGLNILLDNVQKDNDFLRKQQERDRVELTRVREKLTVVEEDCKGIRAELAALNATINGT